MKNYSTMRLVVLLAPLVFSFAMGQDIFVPEVPQLLAIFHTNQTYVQLTLSLFLVAAGAGQLIVGPLSDQFGRKYIVLLSTALYAIGSVIAALSPNIGILLFARIIQGIGACGMMVCAFAIVRDVFAGEQAAQVYSYLNGAIAVSPLLAPLLGGYLDAWFGWQAPFVCLAVLGIVTCALIIFFISETLLPAKRVVFDKRVFKNYWQVVRNRSFILYSFAAGSALACFFTFFSVSSYIIITLLKVPETHFGYYFAIIGITFFFSSLAAGRLVTRVGIFPQVMVGAVGLFVSGVWMLLWNLHSGTSLLSFMLPTALSSVSGAFLMGAGAGGALEPFGEIAGTASAMLGAFEFLFASLVGSIVMHWPVRSDLSYAIPLIVFGVLILLLGISNKCLRKAEV